MNDRFKVGVHGLSPDMEDFMLERAEKHWDGKDFWGSFWKVCTDMWADGLDLSHKQLNIINREYNKVKDDRKKAEEKTT